MIIEKKDISINDNVCFRLTSGEEIIGKLLVDDKDGITIQRPICIQIQVVGPNKAGLGFTSFMASADESNTKFRFPRSVLLCDPVKPRTDILHQYIKMTTGLEVPTLGASLLAP